MNKNVEVDGRGAADPAHPWQVSPLTAGDGPEGVAHGTAETGAEARPRRSLGREWFRHRIRRPVAVTTLLILVAVHLSFVFYLRWHTAELLRQDLRNLHSLWSQVQQQHVERLSGLLDLIAQQPGVREALERRDQTALLEYSRPLTQRLHQSFHVEFLAFLDPSGEVLAHDPQAMDWRPSPQGGGWAAAASSGRLVAGLELDAEHGLMLNALLPWYQEGRLIGYVGIGDRVNHLLDQLRAFFPMRQALLVDARYLAQVAGGSGDATEVGNSAWARFRTLVPLSGDGPPIPPALWAQLVEHGMAAFEDGELFEADGQEYFAGTLSLKDGVGRGIGHLVLLRDVTDRQAVATRIVWCMDLLVVAVAVLVLWYLTRVVRRTEGELEVYCQELEGSHRQLETAHRQWQDSFDAITDPIFIHDRRFRVLRANRAYAEQAGMSFQELIGRFYWQCFPRREGPLPGCCNAMRGERAGRMDEPLMLPDGRHFISHSFLTGKGEDGYAVHLLEDVTERDRLATALRQREAQYYELFNAMLDGFALHEIIVDETGRPCDYRFLDVNPAFVALTGFGREQVVGRTALEVLADLDPFWIEVYGQVAQSGAAVRFSSIFPTVDRYFEVLAFCPESGRFATLFRDVGKVKQSLDRLRREIRTRRVISRSNHALIEARNEDELLQTICRIITDVGGYSMAWVSFKEAGAKQAVRPVGYSGAALDDRQLLGLIWGEGENDRTLTAAAMRSGENQLAQDVQHDPGFQFSAAIARQLGYRSAVALPLRRDDQTFGALFIGARELDAFNADDIRLLEELAGDLAYGIVSLRARADRDLAEQQHLLALEQLKASLGKTVNAMASAVETRDPYTAGHERRVAGLAVAIAEEMGLDNECIESIRIAATIHDIGKIYVPAELLSKPGRLTSIEFELIKTHSQVGYDILKDIDFPWPVAQMVLQHHERLDGSGYPQGLKGEAILLEARILGVADVVEAISAHRPYRPALGVEVALEEIQRQRGIAYDPAVVDACLRLFAKNGDVWNRAAASRTRTPPD